VGPVPIGQIDVEFVVAARLALVTRQDCSMARLTIDGDVVFDSPATRVAPRIGIVCGDCRLFHVHADAVIDVVEVAPQRAVPPAAGDTEVGPGARRRAGNPAAARHEVVTWRRLRRWWIGSASTGGSSRR